MTMGEIVTGALKIGTAAGGVVICMAGIAKVWGSGGWRAAFAAVFLFFAVVGGCVLAVRNPLTTASAASLRAGVCATVTTLPGEWFHGSFDQ